MTEIYYEEPLHLSEDYIIYTVLIRTRETIIEEWTYSSYSLRKGWNENVINFNRVATESNGYKFIWSSNLTIKEPYNTFEKLKTIFENKETDWYDTIKDYIIEDNMMATYPYDETIKEWDEEFLKLKEKHI
tara:strand:+ start:61 stop:453 length:393 start_codon:yes stop_codon:yes gene_type:complete